LPWHDVTDKTHFMVTSSPLHTHGRWRPANFIAGHPALELANTIAHRRDPALAEDRVATLPDLADWARSLGLDAGCHPPDEADVPRLAALRAVVHNAFAAVAAQQEPPREAVAAMLRAAADGLERPQPPRLHEMLAWRAIQALATLPPDRVGACPACGWLFLDTSKSGRRRWCAMATCGTVAKVRSFRARQDNIR
jgi:predicted RNA-binding Zn ribbon-like protein